MLLIWVSHHALVKRGKDKTVRKSTILKQSIGTRIVKVLRCIPRPHIVLHTVIIQIER